MTFDQKTREDFKEQLRFELEYEYCIFFFA